jgi:hypothetical protein
VTSTTIDPGNTSATTAAWCGRIADSVDAGEDVLRAAAVRASPAGLAQRSRPVRRMLERLSAPERAALCRGLSILQEELGIGQA